MGETIYFKDACPEFRNETFKHLKILGSRGSTLDRFPSWFVCGNKKTLFNERFNAYWYEIYTYSWYEMNIKNKMYCLTNTSRNQLFKQYSYGELRQLLRDLKNAIDSYYTIDANGTRILLDSCFRSVSRLSERKGKEKVIALIKLFKDEMWFKKWLKTEKKSLNQFIKEISRPCCFYFYVQKQKAHFEPEENDSFDAMSCDKDEQDDYDYEENDKNDDELFDLNDRPIRASTNLSVMLSNILEDFVK